MSTLDQQFWISESILSDGQQMEFLGSHGGLCDRVPQRYESGPQKVTVWNDDSIAV